MKLDKKLQKIDYLRLEKGLILEDGPICFSKVSLSRSNIKKTDLVSIFESQVLSRHMDIKARLLKDEGKCYYTIGSSGHEQCHTTSVL